MYVRIRVISLEQLFLKKLRWANLDQVSFSHSCVKPNYQNYELGCFEIGKSSDLGARKNHRCIQLLGIEIPEISVGSQMERSKGIQSIKIDDRKTNRSVDIN